MGHSMEFQMIVLKMKVRDYLLSISRDTRGGSHLVHVDIRHDGHINPNVLKFKTWNDAVLGTKELFESDKGVLSINDYEPMEIPCGS